MLSDYCISRHARYFRKNRDQWMVMHHVYSKIHHVVLAQIAHSSQAVNMPTFSLLATCHWLWNWQRNVSGQTFPDPYRLCQGSGPSRKSGVVWGFQITTQPGAHQEIDSRRTLVHASSPLLHIIIRLQQYIHWQSLWILFARCQRYFRLPGQ